MARAATLQQALAIALPESAALTLDSCRRLLGPNLYGPGPGAVGDALSPGIDPAALRAAWVADLRRVLKAMDWGQVPITERPFAGGCSLYIPAPVDQLFTAAYLIEAAWHFTANRLLGLAPRGFDAMVADLRRVAMAEASPALVALVAGAAARGIDHLLDDDAVTLGQGTGARTWDGEALPGAPDWAALHDLPLALVTGTNGKTTTTRLIAAMAAASGKLAGLSSTDGVQVGTEVLDHGDYSGPAGARLLLRDARVELAVLEVARGGILRRGLPVTRAAAAVVTNVAADHLGQYGINTVADLAEVKLAVQRALRPGGALILNADDVTLRAAAAKVERRPVWFSLSSECSDIRRAWSDGTACGWLGGGDLWLSDGVRRRALIAARDVPLTLAGAARYNIENALAASLAAQALGLPDDAIRAALAAFRSDPADNPGRANEFAVRGARVFVDFAHNPHSIAAITSALAALAARRRLVLLAHAGDRSDDEIRALAAGALTLRPEGVVIAENPKYLRGRATGEVPGLIRERCLAGGLSAAQLSMADSPAEGARQVIAQLGPGDLALLLVHDQRDEIFAMLRVAGNSGPQPD